MKKLLILVLLPVFFSCATQEFVKIAPTAEIIQSKKDKGELFLLSNIWAARSVGLSKATVDYRQENYGLITGTIRAAVKNDTGDPTVMRVLTHYQEIEFSFMIEIKDKKVRLSFYDAFQRNEMGKPVSLNLDAEAGYKALLTEMVKDYSAFVETYKTDW